MSRRHHGFIGLALVAVLVTGCGSDNQTAPTSLTALTSASTLTDSSSVATTPVSSASSAEANTSDATATLSNAAVSNPWPDDFTPEQVAASQAAIEAFTKSVDTFNQAQQNPLAKDWSKEILLYTAPPLSDEMIQQIFMFAKFGLHVAGAVAYDSIRVSSANSNSVSISSCRDYSQIDTLDGDGNSVLEAGEEPLVPLVANITMILTDSGWKSEAESSELRLEC